jgi:hypothetical protein
MLVGGDTEMKPSVSGTAHQQLHADIGAEAVAGDPGLGGGRVVGLQPVQRRGRVGQLADAAVELALAAAHAAEVEAQGRETALHEQVVQLHRDRVVHVPARLGVRVQDQRDRRIVGLARRIAALDTARGSGQNHVRHSRSLSKKGRRGRLLAPIRGEGILDHCAWSS